MDFWSKAIVCVALVLSLLPAQSIEFENLSVEHGLSQSQVTSIYQDRFGLMWFGTRDGLNRFDGYDFQVFYSSETDSASILGNSITGIIESPVASNHIWISTWAGLTRYDFDSESFQRIKISASISAASQHFPISQIGVSAAGVIWVSGENKIVALDPITSQILTFITIPQTSEANPSPWIRAMSLVENGDSLSIWLGTDVTLLELSVPDSRQALRTYDLRSEDLTDFRFTHPDNLEKLRGKTVVVHSDHRGEMWIAVEHSGLFILSGERTELEPFIVPESEQYESKPDWLNLIRTINEDQSKNLWIGSYNSGLMLLNPTRDAIQYFTENEAEVGAISSNYIIDLFEDRDGLMWIGTNGSGVDKVEPHRRKFKHLRAYAHNQNSLSHRSVLAVHEDSKENVWIGTVRGLTRYNLKKDSWKRYYEQDGNDASLPANLIYTIKPSAVFGVDAFWIGTTEGLARYMPEEDSFVQYNIPVSGSKQRLQNTIVSLLERNDGSLWLGTRNGVAVIKDIATPLASYSIEHYLHNPNNPSTLCNNTTVIIYEDAFGVLWVGTEYGLSRFIPESESFVNYWHDPNDSSSLSNNWIEVLYHDTLGGRDDLWIGTKGGLNRYDREAATFTSLRMEDGLPNNVVVGILPDSAGNLWLSTFHGLAKFEPESGHIESFDMSDGLQNYEFNWGAYHAGRSGRLYFGGVGGLNYFSPSRIVKNIRPPHILITDFRVFNRHVRPLQPFGDDEEIVLRRPIYEAPAIELPYNYNHFAFEFAALNYTAPEKNRYAYMLEGFHDDWIHSGRRRYASFTNLDPGDYTFRVIGANNDGVWNQSGASIRVFISPPFWMTWWFRILAVLVLIAIPLLIYRYRMNQLLEIERLRVRISSDLHDDIGATLNAVAMQSELLGSGVELEDRNERLQNVASLSRQAVRMLSDVVWSIDARNDRAQNLVERVMDFSDLMLSRQNVAVTYHLDELDGTLVIPIEARQNIYLVSKEAIANIAKYAQATKVDIHISNLTDSFILQIKDNGIGSHDARRRSGHGLRNMQLRANRLNGELILSNHDGFTVTMRCPLN